MKKKTKNEAIKIPVRIVHSKEKTHPRSILWVKQDYKVALEVLERQHKREAKLRLAIIIVLIIALLLVFL